MPHVLFVWNDESVEYIGQHGVTPEEFEEVVLNAKTVKRSRSSGHPLVFGPTSKRENSWPACSVHRSREFEVLPVTAFEVDE